MVALRIAPVTRGCSLFCGGFRRVRHLPLQRLKPEKHPTSAFVPAKLITELGTSSGAAGSLRQAGPTGPSHQELESSMNSIIYLIGLVVVVLAILSFFGLR
jgi:hypothetical protein